MCFWLPNQQCQSTEAIATNNHPLDFSFSIQQLCDYRDLMSGASTQLVNVNVIDVDSGLLHVRKTNRIIIRRVLDQCNSKSCAQSYLLSFILLLCRCIAPPSFCSVSAYLCYARTGPTICHCGVG